MPTNPSHPLDNPRRRDGEGEATVAAPKLRVLSLFAGIGGFDLGLERTGGFETVAFCEIEPFARKVLAKNWTEVPCYHDVRKLNADQLATDSISVDVICGGFPCQDISFAGAGAGLDGERSALWFEYARLIRELRPAVVIVENVAALLYRGMGEVLGTLASLGYDADWDCIRASELGAPHHRDRVWLIAHRHEIRWDWPGLDLVAEDVLRARSQWTAAPFSDWRDVVNWLESPDAAHLWQTADASDRRMDDGVLRGLDSPAIGACGNAVVPQIPELIGRAILASLNHPTPASAGVSSRRGLHAPADAPGGLCGVNHHVAANAAEAEDNLVQ